MEETWFDDAAGPLVRPYTVTRGRTRTSRIELDLVTLIVAVPHSPAHSSGHSMSHADGYSDGQDGSGGPEALEPEYREILTLCRLPTSIAEISARLNLPLGVVKVLVGDLIERRQVIYRSGITPAPDVLQAVLEGIRRL
jgi:uncharacterized protein DUF742